MSLLPFLKNSKDKSMAAGGVMTIERKPDGDPAPSDDAMEAAAQDILRAISQKDYKHLAQAIRAAFEIADSEPHVEGPHIGEEGLE